jgi:hypothetical protein
MPKKTTSPPESGGSSGCGFLDGAEIDPVLQKVADHALQAELKAIREESSPQRQAAADQAQARRRADLTGSAPMRELRRLSSDLLDQPRKERLPLLREAAGNLSLRVKDPELRTMLSEAWLASRGRCGPLRPGDRLDLNPQQWHLPGLLLKRGSHLLIAQPKVGKSSWVLGLIAAWSRGETFLGRAFTEPCPEVVLVWPDQGEGDVARMLAAAGLLGSDGGVRAPIVALWHAGRPLHLDEEGIATIAEEATRRPGCLVVVDSYAAGTRVMGLEEASAEFAGPLQGLVEEVDPTGATLLVVHHAGKSRAGEGPAALSRGTTALPAVPSMLLALGKVNPIDREDQRLLLMVEGRGGPPETLAIVRDGDRWTSCGTGEEIAAEVRREAAREKLTPRQEAALEVVERRWGDGQGESTVADLVADPDCELEGKHAGRLGRKVLQALGRMRLVQLRKVGTGISARPWSADGPQGPLSAAGPIGLAGPQISQLDGPGDQEDQEDSPGGEDLGGLCDRLQVEADQILLTGMQ